MWGLVLLTLLALEFDFRARIAVALAVALTLALSLRKGWRYTWPQSRMLAYLGKISCSVFLLNFPVALARLKVMAGEATPYPRFSHALFCCCNAFGAKPG